MDLVLLGIAFVSSFTGALIQAVCGFGNGPINMAVLPHIFPYQYAVALTSLCGFVMSVTIVVTNWKHVNFRMMLPCALTSIVFSSLSVHLSVGAARSVMMHSLGVMLILLGIYNIFFNGKISFAPTIRNGIIAGIISGICSGMFGMSGPTSAIFVLAASESKEEYRATLNAVFVITVIGALTARIREGTITAAVVHTWLLLLIAVAAGLLVGSCIFNRLNQRTMRICVYGFLIISGISMLLN